MPADSGGLQTWLDNLERAKEGFPEFLEGFLKRIAWRAIVLTKANTPVASGKLREAWIISEVELVGDQLSVFLINPLEYASYVENGHLVLSKNGNWWFEGFFMARIALGDVEQMMPAIYRTEFKAYCTKMGVG